MKTEDFGICVNIQFKTDSRYFRLSTPIVKLHNVTEIHYNYNRHYDRQEPRIAFESDIHGTGLTVDFSEILEFETEPETEKAENF